MFDPEIETTQSYVDAYNMLLGQNYSWDPNGDHGQGDCISDTVIGYITWEWEPFIKSVKSCYKWINIGPNGYLQAYRHPSLLSQTGYNDMSRDHITYTLILMKYIKDDAFLNNMSKNLRWRISDKYSFTLDLWLWMKGINGNKIAMFLYYCLQIPLMSLNVRWNKYLKKKGNFGPEIPQDKFVALSPEEIPPKQVKLRKYVYPVYALHQVGLMMMVSPDSFGKRTLKKICLKDVGEQNFLLKILFGGKVSQEEVDGYKAMTSWRWSTWLNNLNDRDVSIITDPDRLKANVLDVEFLKKIYTKLK